GQRADLQPDRDRQGQRPGALRLAAPGAGTPAQRTQRRGLRSAAAVELLAGLGVLKINTFRADGVYGALTQRRGLRSAAAMELRSELGVLKSTPSWRTGFMERLPTHLTADGRGRAVDQAGDPAQAEALGMTDLNGGAFFNAEFGIGHRGNTVPERSGVALSFCGRPL